MRKEIAGLIDSMRRRGLFTTLRLLASDIWFDAFHGTETRTVLEGDQLGDVASTSQREVAIYHAVNPLIFNRALDAVASLASDTVFQGSFVDFGSGKGRALLLARKRGFSKFIGIEHSPVLDALCRKNLRAAQDRDRVPTIVDLHFGDAAQFPVPDDSTVWFWFNPFDIDTTATVANNIIASLQRNPRDAYLIYARPNHVKILHDLHFSTVKEVRLARSYIDALILSYSSVGRT